MSLAFSKKRLRVMAADTKEDLGGAPSLDLVTACECQDEPVLAYRDGSGTWQPATRVSNRTGLELVLVRVVKKASS